LESACEVRVHETEATHLESDLHVTQRLAQLRACLLRFTSLFSADSTSVVGHVTGLAVTQQAGRALGLGCCLLQLLPDLGQ